eukprot:TRINITY_DN62168_c0_g1_i4.p1 TRINITY_DN62168_c0_g1~~TRINITY_DN62168_c0_g1_i4.p1  ORF type:complete len:155 (-),score=27.34 TRINITY_DN62168_c0_g1_i4:149-613(-)
MSAGIKAHAEAEGVIKDRMELMKTLGKSMKGLGPMVTGKASYDADKVRELAVAIAEHGGTKLTDLFPKDSLSDESEALPVIWTDWAGFEAKASDLVVFANALAKAAGNDPTGAVPADLVKDPGELATLPPLASFKAVGSTCGGCHKTFRKEKKS